MAVPAGPVPHAAGACSHRDSSEATVELRLLLQPNDADTNLHLQFIMPDTPDWETIRLMEDIFRHFHRPGM